MSDAALFVAVFLACVVEAVEATTIVLAAGTARNWRSAPARACSPGVVLLAVVDRRPRPRHPALPLGSLRLVVGGLLLVFGLQWLRKAILRASGHKALHDEAADLPQTRSPPPRARRRAARRSVADWYAFTLSFKGVVLEGLEVVFIVLTFGTNQKTSRSPRSPPRRRRARRGRWASRFAAPLARVPENTMKFVVGDHAHRVRHLLGRRGRRRHLAGRRRLPARDRPRSSPSTPSPRGRAPATPPHRRPRRPPAVSRRCRRDDRRAPRGRRVLVRLRDRRRLAGRPRRLIALAVTYAVSR